MSIHLIAALRFSVDRTELTEALIDVQDVAGAVSDINIVDGHLVVTKHNILGTEVEALFELPSFSQADQLSSDIEAEATLRGDADALLLTRLNSEITTRAEADALLVGRVVTLESSSGGGGGGLTGAQVNTLINNSGHASQTDLSTEVTDRALGDEALGVRIDNIDTTIADDSIIEAKLAPEVRTKLNASVTITSGLVFDESNDRFGWSVAAGTSSFIQGGSLDIDPIPDQFIAIWFVGSTMQIFIKTGTTAPATLEVDGVSYPLTKIDTNANGLTTWGGFDYDSYVATSVPLAFTAGGQTKQIRILDVDGNVLLGPPTLEIEIAERIEGDEALGVRIDNIDTTELEEELATIQTQLDDVSHVDEKLKTIKDEITLTKDTLVTVQQGAGNVSTGAGYSKSGDPDDVIVSILANFGDFTGTEFNIKAGADPFASGYNTLKIKRSSNNTFSYFALTKISPTKYRTAFHIGHSGSVTYDLDFVKTDRSVTYFEGALEKVILSDKFDLDNIINPSGAITITSGVINDLNEYGWSVAAGTQTGYIQGGSLSIDPIPDQFIAIYSSTNNTFIEVKTGATALATLEIDGVSYPLTSDTVNGEGSTYWGGFNYDLYIALGNPLGLTAVGQTKQIRILDAEGNLLLGDTTLEDEATARIEGDEALGVRIDSIDTTIADDSITEPKLSSGVRTKLNASGGSLTIEDDSITTVKIQDNAVIESKLSAGVRIKLNTSGDGTIYDPNNYEDLDTHNVNNKLTGIASEETSEVIHGEAIAVSSGRIFENDHNFILYGWSVADGTNSFYNQAGSLGVDPIPDQFLAFGYNPEVLEIYVKAGTTAPATIEVDGLSYVITLSSSNRPSSGRWGGFDYDYYTAYSAVRFFTYSGHTRQIRILDADGNVLLGTPSTPAGKRSVSYEPYDPSRHADLPDHNEARDLNFIVSEKVPEVKFDRFSLLLGGTSDIALYGSSSSSITTAIGGSIANDIEGFTIPAIWIYSGANDDVQIKWGDTFNDFWTEAKARSIKSLKIVRKSDGLELKATYNGDESANYTGTGVSDFVEYDRIDSLIDGSDLISKSVDIFFYTSTDATGEPILFKETIPESSVTVNADSSSLRISLGLESSEDAQIFKLFILNDTSELARAGTFPTSKITNYFPGFMNFTGTADNSAPNPIGSDNAISVQIDSDGNYEFEYIERVTEDGSIIFPSGVPIFIHCSGGLHIQDIPTGSLYFVQIERQVLLRDENGALNVISRENSGRYRAVRGTAFVPFGELSYVFVPPIDLPYGGSFVKYILKIESDEGAVLPESSSLTIWIEPDTKEVVTQLNPVLKGTKGDTGDINNKEVRALIGTYLRVETRDPSAVDSGRVWFNTSNGKTFHNSGGVWAEDPRFHGQIKSNNFNLSVTGFTQLEYTGFTETLFSGFATTGTNYNATWGGPSNYVQASNLNNILKILLSQLVDCSFSVNYEQLEVLYYKTVDLTTPANVEIVTACGYSTRALLNRSDRRRIDEIIFYTSNGIKYYKWNTTTSSYEDLTLTTNIVAADHRADTENETDGVLKQSEIASARTTAIATAVANRPQTSDFSTIRVLTQVEYDAIAVKSDTILYLITTETS